MSRIAWAIVALPLLGCAGGGTRDRGDITLRFWTFGREGEVVQALVPAFERAHPGIHVRVQQIPFTAAHEKLLTAVVGDATPDVAQLGNTWIAELAVLRALAPLDSLVARTPEIARGDYFPGIWSTNIVDGAQLGLPWYVDTRVLFYRSDLLADAGYPTPPRSWSGWREAMGRVRSRSGGRRYGVFLPVNEWAPPVMLALAAGAPLLRDGDRFADFGELRFQTAFDFYVGLYRDRLAPPLSNVQIANRYQSFANGEFAMFVSGPWDIGECQRRLPPTMTGRWTTAAMPAPGVDTAAPGTSLAGGSSLVIFRRSSHPEAAWALVRYLSEPATQVAFYRLSEDLPARRSAWDDPAIAGNPYTRAFGVQLQNVRATPLIPEWEQIATLIADHAEAAARGATTAEAALSGLNRDVDDALDKRRWLLADRRHRLE